MSPFIEMGRQTSGAYQNQAGPQVDNCQAYLSGSSLLFCLPCASHVLEAAACTLMHLLALCPGLQRLGFSSISIGHAGLRESCLGKLIEIFRLAIRLLQTGIPAVCAQGLDKSPPC